MNQVALLPAFRLGSDARPRFFSPSAAFVFLGHTGKREVRCYRNKVRGECRRYAAH